MSSYITFQAMHGFNMSNTHLLCIVADDRRLYRPPFSPYNTTFEHTLFSKNHIFFSKIKNTSILFFCKIKNIYRFNFFQKYTSDFFSSKNRPQIFFSQKSILHAFLKPNPYGTTMNFSQRLNWIPSLRTEYRQYSHQKFK